MQKLGDIVKKLDSSEYKRDKYVSREFQKYGYDLAMELGDLKNRAMYIKLASTQPRALLESARSFVKDAQNVRNRPALFLWKFRELKKVKGVVKKGK